MNTQTYRAAILLLLGGLALAGWAQQGRFPYPSPPSRRSSDDTPPLRPSQSVKMLKQSFEQTQKDSVLLYDLATELKHEMEKANEDVLSITVMRKAEEIEKLAEKIKNRMKNL
jgi:hypothetical protein